MDYELLFIIATILLLPAILFAFWAQWRVHSVFNRTSGEMSMSGQTGAAVARQLLDQNGCHDVTIEMTRGHLSDHYDPRKKVVRLSADVHNSASLAALGVAAHEVGHAVQDNTNYGPLKLRQLIVRVTRITNILLLPLIILGFIGMIMGMFIFHADFFFWFIVALCALYGISTLAMLATVPVELDASRRAKAMLDQSGIVTDQDEMDGVKSVLTAAALTYVAALVVSLVHFLRLFALVMMAKGRR
ncbi:MAG: zinc metallopeptidase [Firmicutes bacterium]|nr:zinc metallopeptidase [Bacillota bacterium]